MFRARSIEHLSRFSFSCRPRMLCFTGLMLQCLLQVSLVGAARPLSNDDLDKKARVSLNMGTTMRPEGAYARQQAIVVDVQQNSFQHNRSSLLQTTDPTLLNSSGDLLASTNQSQVLPSTDSVSSLDSSNGSLPGDGVQQLGDGAQQLGDGVQTEPVVTPVVNDEVVDEKPVDAKKEKKPALSDTIENAAALVDGEEVKLFKDANRKVDEMEAGAGQMQEKLAVVNEAWGHVDGKLNQYKDSIGELAKQFNVLDEASKGIHDEVKTDFKGREKFRMCSFMNAQRVLNGEPEKDCTTEE